MTRKLTWIDGETSMELRDAYVQLNFLPQAKAMMARDDGVQSVLLVVAQYWADEADDAVHIEAVPCAVLDPVWPECVRESPFYALDEDYLEQSERGQKATGEDLHWNKRPTYPDLDCNGSAITAFASYCAEPVSQEDSLDQSSTPYAIARRAIDGDGTLTLKLEVVGTMHRPEWEDHFDVGFAAKDSVTSKRLYGKWHEGAGRGKLEPDSNASEKVAMSAGTSPPRPSFWRRLLGRG